MTYNIKKQLEKDLYMWFQTIKESSLQSHLIILFHSIQ